MRAVCVFCGSNAGARDEYAQAAQELGRELARRNLSLIYGGSKLGLMGLMADACLEAGGEAVGVMPSFFIEREQAHPGLSRFVTVNDMPERKEKMGELADAFIAMPGGLGTLDELFEAMTWTQLGKYAKPCGLLNVAGYYDGLDAFLDHVTGERFMRPEHRRILVQAADPAGLLEALSGWTPVSVKKWY